MLAFKTQSRLQYLSFLLAVIAGRHTFNRSVELMESPSIECQLCKGSAEELFVEADGEVLGRLPVRLEVVPHSLTLLIPPAYSRDEFARGASILIEISFRCLHKTAKIVRLPTIRPVQLAGQNVGDGRRGFDGGACIEKEGPRAPGEDILDRSRHFITRSPNDFAQPKGQARMQEGVEIRNRGVRVLGGSERSAGRSDP